ncbi:MAG: hypothetical protein ACE5IK_11945 [Acidobacteriota bacterium]
MTWHQRAVLLSLALTAALALAPATAQTAGQQATSPPAGPAPAVVLVGTDYPQYKEVVGHLSLLGGHDAKVMSDVAPEYRRLSLADIETTPFLPEGFSIDQTVSTGVDLPVNLNFVVDDEGRGACFNPEVPYCTGFELLNRWLESAGLTIDSEAKAGKLARFVVGLGLSTVHHPRDFLFFRISQPFGVENYQYFDSIDALYDKSRAAYRTEAKQKEFEAMSAKYRDVIHPPTMLATDDGFLFEAFTYKIMRSAGDLRQWRIMVHRDGTVQVDLQTLETGIGELYWSWAP